MPEAKSRRGSKKRTKVAQPKKAPVLNLDPKDRPFAFLEALGETGSIIEACRISGYPRRTAYDRRNSDVDFAQAWDVARNLGADALEDEAVRRAREGTDKPVYQGGILVGYIKEFSDTLLIFLLKGLKPEKFRDRISTEITGKDGGPVEISDARKRNTSLIEAVASRIAGKASAGSEGGGS